MIQKIKNNQHSDKHMHTMKQIFTYVDELFIANKDKEVDEFILKFCNEEMCFQYYVCLLTAALWKPQNITNLELLRKKTIEAGTKEIGKKDTLTTLRGLI